MKSKSEKKIKQTADHFIDEVVSLFPGVEAVLMNEVHGGYDFWISVRLPAEMRSRETEILYATIDISDRLEDETGISSYATVGVPRTASASRRELSQ